MKHPFTGNTWQRLAVAAGTLAASASVLAGPVGNPNLPPGGSVPEPSILSLIAAGVAAGLVGRHLRRRK